ncbi:MAG: DUF6194 family protein [Chloroflexota bacterium]
MTDGPIDQAIADYITSTYEAVDVAATGGGTFFSCDPKKHWPNFATLVTTDDFDDASNLSREGVYRLNIGVTGKTFDATLGEGALDRDHDYTALDTWLPHPVYGRQHWLSILNPSTQTFESQVKPLLDEAYDVVAGRAERLSRRGPGATR